MRLLNGLSLKNGGGCNCELIAVTHRVWVGSTVNERWIAMCLHDTTNNYQRLLWDDAKKVAARHNHSVNAYFADKSADKQVEQIRSILDLPANRRPTAIMVNAVRENILLGVAKDAAAKGIAWVYLCRWTNSIEDLRRTFPRVPVFSVSPNQHSIGQIQGMQLRVLLKPEDELVYIQGPSGTSTSQRRLNAARQVLSDRTNLKWTIFNSDWSGEGGHATMKGWLEIFTHGQLPNFVLAAQNDDMANGARRALFEWASAARSVPLEKLRFIGCDGIPTFGQRLVTEGELSATVAVPSVSGPAVNEVFESLSKGRPPPAEIQLDATSFPPLEELTKRFARRHGKQDSTTNEVSPIPRRPGSR